MLGRGNKVLSIQVDNLGENVGIMYGSRSVYDIKIKWNETGVWEAKIYKMVLKV